MSIVNIELVSFALSRWRLNEDGAVSKKQMKIDRDSQLENTLLKADYPDICVATIDIPQQQLDQNQQAMVESIIAEQTDRLRRRGVHSRGRFGIREEWQVLRC